MKSKSMTPEMTDERLQEIKERLENLTPAPWWVEPSDGQRDAFIAYGTRGDLSETYDLIENYNLDDYEFMARSRQDVPELLDYVSSLRARIIELESERKADKDCIRVLDKLLLDYQAERVKHKADRESLELLVKIAAREQKHLCVDTILAGVHCIARQKVRDAECPDVSAVLGMWAMALPTAPEAKS